MNPSKTEDWETYSFKELNSVLISKSLTLCCRNRLKNLVMKLLLTQNSEWGGSGGWSDQYPLAFVHVSLVPNQDLVNIIWRMLFNITNPVPNICNNINNLEWKRRDDHLVSRIGGGGFYCWRRTRRWHHRPTKCPSPHGNKLSKCKIGKLKCDQENL